MKKEQKRQNGIIQEPEPLYWLNTISLADHDYMLNKSEFYNDIGLRRSWSIPKLPSKFTCGENFNVQDS